MFIDFNFMKILLYTVLFCLLESVSFGQTINCICKLQNETIVKPIKVFHLTKTKSIAVCGTSEPKNGKIEYSEFSLHQCGLTKIINEWDGTQTCTIKQNKDTLIVQEFYGIPNGERFSVKWREFYVYKYYFKGNRLIDTLFFRDDLKKYTNKEIQIALFNFEKIQGPITKSDKYLIAVNRLFWAYVSGSKKAEKHLLNLKKKYGTFDGAVSEDFDRIIMTFQYYKELQK